MFGKWWANDKAVCRPYQSSPLTQHKEAPKCWVAKQQATYAVLINININENSSMDRADSEKSDNPPMPNNVKFPDMPPNKKPNV
jgi:hypothetical protein